MLRGAILIACFATLVSARPESYIVNGTDADIQEFPFIVSIRSRYQSHSCGGAIIAPKWILTAAHCMEGRDIKGVTIQYGITTVDKNGPNVARAKRYIIHEKYDPNAITDDIALIEMKGTFIYNYRTIAPVTLPAANFETNQDNNGIPGTLIGWGVTVTGGSISTVLQKADLKIYSDEECARRHTGQELSSSISTNNICGGVDGGWKGQCNGDSGGPLLYQGHIQVGIVSWSYKPCQIPPFPGVYTKVSHYIDWINKNMNS